MDNTEITNFEINPYKEAFEKRFTETKYEEIDLTTLRDKKGNAYCFFINENNEIDCKSYNYEEELNSSKITFEDKIRNVIRDEINGGKKNG